MKSYKKILLVLGGVLLMGGGTIYALSGTTSQVATSNETIGGSFQPADETESLNPEDTENKETIKSTTNASAAVTVPKTNYKYQTQPKRQGDTDTLPPIDTSGLRQACLDLKQAYINSHEADTNAETVTYESNLDAIDSNYQSRGMGGSGAHQAARAAETERHHVRQELIDNDFEELVASLDC